MKRINQITYLFQSNLVIFIKRARFLFVAEQRKYQDIPQKTLRDSSLKYHAEKFGPQYLHDALGLSVTHTARYGNPTDWLIEEILADALNET